MTEATVFDTASLTKILAVWAVTGTLWDSQRLRLDDRLDELIPYRTSGYPLGQVTVRQLLTHTAGVPLRAALKAMYGTDPPLSATASCTRTRTGLPDRPSSTQTRGIAGAFSVLADTIIFVRHMGLHRGQLIPDLRPGSALRSPNAPLRPPWTRQPRRAGPAGRRGPGAGAARQRGGKSGPAELRRHVPAGTGMPDMSAVPKDERG